MALNIISLLPPGVFPLPESGRTAGSDLPIAHSELPRTTGRHRNKAHVQVELFIRIHSNMAQHNTRRTQDRVNSLVLEYEATAF